MRQHGIRARGPRRYRVCTTDSKHSLPVAENLLEQDFVADRPNQVWLADITYIPTSQGWLYGRSEQGVGNRYPPLKLQQPVTG
jgi:putative transposase